MRTVEDTQKSIIRRGGTAGVSGVIPPISSRSFTRQPVVPSAASPATQLPPSSRKSEMFAGKVPVRRSPVPVVVPIKVKTIAKVIEVAVVSKPVYDPSEGTFEKMGLSLEPRRIDCMITSTCPIHTVMDDPTILKLGRNKCLKCGRVITAFYSSLFEHLNRIFRVKEAAQRDDIIEHSLGAGSAFQELKLSALEFFHRNFAKVKAKTVEDGHLLEYILTGFYPQLGELPPWVTEEVIPNYGSLYIVKPERLQRDIESKKVIYPLRFPKVSPCCASAIKEPYEIPTDAYYFNERRNLELGYKSGGQMRAVGNIEVKMYSPSEVVEYNPSLLALSEGGTKVVRAPIRVKTVTKEVAFPPMPFSGENVSKDPIETSTAAGSTWKVVGVGYTGSEGMETPIIRRVIKAD